MDEPFDSNETHDNELFHIRKFFLQHPWRFHHKVDVTGKLISCHSNEQDYYEYSCIGSPSETSGKTTKGNEEKKKDFYRYSNDHVVHFPLWGARKVHYGKRLLRFTLFVSYKNWEDQIHFYKLILQNEEISVRDDFCYFITFENGNTVIQLALKKLPNNVQPQPLVSSILQFKVKNIGHLVPLLPTSCEPISELRWRTRDHDTNIVLFQIKRSKLYTGTSFIKKMFTHIESAEAKHTKRKTKKLKSKRDPNEPQKTSTPKPKKESNQSEASNVENNEIEAQQLEDGTLKRKHTEPTDNTVNTEHEKETESNKYQLSDSEKSQSLEKTNFLRTKSIETESPVLPTQKDSTEPTIYFQTNSRNSSINSSGSSNKSTTETSEYYTSRETSPESGEETVVNVQCIGKEKIIYMTKKHGCLSPNVQKSSKEETRSAVPHENQSNTEAESKSKAPLENLETKTSSPKKPLPLSLSREEGFYV